MPRLATLGPIVGLLALGFGTSGTALALGPRDDGARLFSREALQRAAESTEETKEQYRKDFRIHTYAGIPWTRDKLGKFKKMDALAREQFFTEWARGEARKYASSGVFVLICKEPLAVRVVVRPPIGTETGEKLQDEMLSLLREKKNDEALDRAVAVYREALDARYQGVMVNPPFNWSGLGSVLLAGLGAWLALCFVHGFSERTFRIGSAGINPLGMAGGTLLAGLRAVRGGLSSSAIALPPAVDPHAPTLSATAAPDSPPMQ